MFDDSISHRISQAMDGMPARLQSAARYVLENPRDVALLSMREQARRAGLQPATMTRLAKRLGFDGYEGVRALHAEAIRRPALDFAGKASAQATSQRDRGDRALAAEMADALARQVAHLAEPASIDRLADAAVALHRAQRVFVLGLRSSHGIAWHLHYILSLFHDRAVLLDSVAGTGLDPMRSAGRDDLLVVASVRPYTRVTVQSAAYASDRGVPIIAITDSPASPLARMARHTLYVSTESPSFFHTMTPAFALAEILAMLVAGRAGPAVSRAIHRTEEQLAALNVHWSEKSGRRRRQIRSAARKS